MTSRFQRLLLYVTCILCFGRISFAQDAAPPAGGFNGGFCGTINPPTPGEPVLLSSLSSLNLPSADTLQEPTVIDVLLLYTPQAVIGVGDEETLRGQILRNLDDANARFTNSRVNVRYHLVYLGLINYTESGDMGTDLDRLATGGGALAQAVTLRNDYKADLVCLITELEQTGIGGWARDIGPAKGNENIFACVLRRVYLRFPLVMAHEFGHLLGCYHERQNPNPPTGDPSYSTRLPYAFGHRFEVEGVTYADTMTYPPVVHLPLFGNKQVHFEGVPTGTDDTEPKPSNAAKTINHVAPYAARYRQALSRIEFEAPTFNASEKDLSVDVLLRRTGDLNTSTRVTINLDAGGSASSGADYFFPASRIVLFETNQATARFTIPLLQNDLVDGTRTFSLSLRSPGGNHGIGWQGKTAVVIEDDDSPPLPVITFPEGRISVRETAGTAVVRIAYLELGAAVNGSIQVPFHTVDGTAVAGEDYQELTGALEFPAEPNGMTRVVNIPVFARAGAGPDRSFFMVAAGRTNEIRIVDNERLGAVLRNPGAEANPDAGLNLLARGDGNMIVWGHFSHLFGQPRTGLALLRRDGSLDPGFVPPEFLVGHKSIDYLGAPYICTVLPLQDGKIIVGGHFSRVNGKERRGVVRLNGDGSVDETFSRELQLGGPVYTIAQDREQRFILGGLFKTANGLQVNSLVRILADGAFDPSFKAATLSADGLPRVSTIALQPDGKILVGGAFDRIEGQSMTNIARLNSDGSRDSSFKLTRGASHSVNRIAIQPDGRILVAGHFATIGTRSSRRIARLNPDGLPDTTFSSPSPNSEVHELVLLPDGRLVIRGYFTSFGSGKSRRFLAVLLPNGALDESVDFGTGPDDLLSNEATYSFGHESSGNAVALRPDGSLLVAGAFKKFNGLPAPNLVQLRFDGARPLLANILANESRPGWSATVFGIAGGSYTIEASSDLQNWQAAGTVQLSEFENSREILLPNGSGNRFFRLSN